MKNKSGWILAGLVLAVVLFLLPGWLMRFGVPLFGSRTWGYGMMDGFGMMGRGFLNPLGWFGMAFMMLIPLGLLVLLAAGVGVVVAGLMGGFKASQPPGQSITGHVCPHCGKPAQVDWIKCPYCGEALS